MKEEQLGTQQQQRQIDHPTELGEVAKEDNDHEAMSSTYMEFK